MPRTSLKNEEELLRRVDAVIAPFSVEFAERKEYVESALAYLLKDRHRESAQHWDDFQSAHEIGKYSGR